LPPGERAVWADAAYLIGTTLRAARSGPSQGVANRLAACLAYFRRGMIETHDPLQALDLRLLLLDGVKQYDVQVIVLNAFDFTLWVVRHQPRLDLGDLLSG